MKNVYSVTQVNSYIKNMFEQDFMLASIWVKGEVSNCKYHSSGHIYFTLKDEKGTIACVMFAGNRSGLVFRLQEGQQVEAGGSIDVYERDGKYQLYAKVITLQGAGLLYERFEQLKRELEEMGMFAAEYKQQIPKYVKKLGVVTAPTGAAVRDIINIACRRDPYVQIILYPAIVQGEQAVSSIIQGIHAMEQQGVDVIIVGRGGGSIEDLWAFNEEAVARAVFDCRVPIISAVGHETDTTMIDFVSDLRAPTPSAAAELAVADIRKTQERIEEYQSVLQRLMRTKAEQCREKYLRFELRLQHNTPLSRIREKRTYAMTLEAKLQEQMQTALLRRRHRLELYIEQFKGLSPLDKLKQGFSYITDASGRTLTDVNHIRVGEQIAVQLANGEIKAKVTDKKQVGRSLS